MIKKIAHFLFQLFIHPFYMGILYMKGHVLMRWMYLNRNHRKLEWEHAVKLQKYWISHNFFNFDHNIGMLHLKMILLMRGIQLNKNFSNMSYPVPGLIWSAFKKHMCFFVLFFHHRCFFLAEIFKKCFFVLFFEQKCAFSVELLIFSEKHDYSEGFEQKRIEFFFKIFCTVLIFWKKKFLASPALAIKFTSICSYCPYISLDMMKIYRHNDWIWWK